MNLSRGQSAERLNVIGSGSWGTALAILACKNLDNVCLWGRSRCESLQSDRENRRYLPGVNFPQNLSIASTLAETVEPGLCFLLVIPSHAFAETATRLHELIVENGHDPGNATVLWGTKGFDPDSGDLPGEIIDGIFPNSTRRGVLSGPSFAAELARGLPTALTLACHQPGVAECLAHWFRSPSTRVYFSDDPIGVQLGAAIKNVMAIATGISDGLGYGANARAALITRGLAEMTRLGIALGGRRETFSGLTGVGDLVLTCTDDQSRNRRFGKGIGAGRSQDTVTQEIDQEIEGIRTTRELHRKALGLGVEMPITEHVFRVLYEGMAPAEAVQRLLGRDPKAEH